MGPHVLLRGRHQRRIEPIINGIGNRLYGTAACRQSFEYLPFTHSPVCQVLLKNRLGLSHFVAVSGKETDRTQSSNPFEG